MHLLLAISDINKNKNIENVTTCRNCRTTGVGKQGRNASIKQFSVHIQSQFHFSWKKICRGVYTEPLCATLYHPYLVFLLFAVYSCRKFNSWSLISSVHVHVYSSTSLTAVVRKLKRWQVLLTPPPKVNFQCKYSYVLSQCTTTVEYKYCSQFCPSFLCAMRFDTFLDY